LLLAQTTSARRSVQPVSRRSGVVAVVDTASRHATASVAAVQRAVSTHPVSASGIRLFSRPVSGHLGSSSRGPPLGRLLSTRPVSSRLLSTRAVSSCLVSSRLVSAPSVRTRPSPPMLRRWRWGLRSRRSGDRDHRNRWGPGGCRVVDGSIDGREAGTRRRWRGRGGHWEVGAGPGRRVGCGPRRPRLPTQRPGRPGRRAERPSRAAARWAREQAATRGGGIRRVAAVLGWVRDHAVWSLPSLTAGWAAPEGPGEVPAGMGVRPQRGPSRQRAGNARCRQRSDLRR
jgi:hypothetical protein